MSQSPFRADSVSATVASVFLRTSCQGCLKETVKKMVLRLLSSPPESPEALFTIVLQFIQDLSKTIPLWPQFVSPSPLLIPFPSPLSLPVFSSWFPLMI
jgi:hypothetical protein